MFNQQDSPKRCILYYPTISIPNGRWLRQSLLYWDEIGSIVPHDYEDKALIPYNTIIQYLKKEGEFRAFRPEELVGQSSSKAEEFEAELKAILGLPSLQRNRERQRNQFSSSLTPREKNLVSINSKIHRDKISARLFYFLEEKGLAIQGEGDWYHFDDITAQLYMSLLAKYLADIDRNYSVPGTNHQVYQDLIYRISSKDKGIECLTSDFQNILPIPRSDVSVRKIVEFKRTRRTELLYFRQIIDEFQKNLKKCENEDEARQIIVSFREDIERGVKMLEAIMRDARLSNIVGSLKTIFKLDSPTLWATGVVLGGHATKIAEIPIEWSSMGIGILGAIEIGNYIIDKRNETRTTLRNSAFSYLYYAQQSKLL